MTLFSANNKKSTRKQKSEIISLINQEIPIKQSGVYE